jgi:hypothetical protein
VRSHVDGSDLFVYRLLKSEAKLCDEVAPTANHDDDPPESTITVAYFSLLLLASSTHTQAQFTLTALRIQDQ